MGILHLYQVTPTGGDCCAGYSVETNRTHRNYTIKELIDLILKERSDEYGYINIYPMLHEDDTPDWKDSKFVCEYDHGEIKSVDQPVLDVYGKYRPIRITSNGGWTRMDYRFYILV